MDTIGFPNIGLWLKNVPQGFYIADFQVRLYGVVIALGFLLGFLLVRQEAKRTKQDVEMYLDFLLILIIPAILGARIYYILFSLDEYFIKGASIGETILGLINIRNGGLAIYGGVIAGAIVVLIFSKKKNVHPLLMMDTIVMGLLVGQILGRWGNFFNREAFGDYTNSFMAMALPLDFYKTNGSFYGLIQANVITQKMLDHTIVHNGIEYITVHPTFLYEGMWNLMILIFLLIYRKYKKFDGEMLCIYLMGYGIGRFFIEALRSDSLYIGGLGIKASQIVAILCVVGALAYMIYSRVRLSKQADQKEV